MGFVGFVGFVEFVEFVGFVGFIKALRWIPPSSAGGRKAEIRRRRIMLLVWSK